MKKYLPYVLFIASSATYLYYSSVFLKNDPPQTPEQKVKRDKAMAIAPYVGIATIIGGLWVFNEIGKNK